MSNLIKKLDVDETVENYLKSINSPLWIGNYK